MKTEFIKLKNKHIELTLSTLGASIYQLSYDGEEMVMTPVNQKDFDKDNFYQGKTIGRVCGRIVFMTLFSMVESIDYPKNNSHMLKKIAKSHSLI